MSFSIAGKTAIVTGAANGVGLAIARHFISEGANVICADMDELKLAEEFGANPDMDILPEADGAEPSNVRIFAGDLRKKLTIANLLSATLDAFDRVDILVNASRQVAASDPLDPDDKMVEALLDQNLMTALRLSRAVARKMIAQAEGNDDRGASIGSIVNLTSIAAHRTRSNLMAFSIASAALEQMTRSMAVALAPEKIRVNAVCFGSVMSASLRESILNDSTVRDTVIQGTPLGRIAEASEVAEAAHFLASDASQFVTGQVVTVDGGRTVIDAVDTVSH
ncbi:SDR family NAD(P)-dependent oxidoreductase [Maritimibacter sp. DP1N21-5]|uniref:SDR family NAD(P)-dependent oxidoreductase n=1 Tax=Maritimibacter sp. DP1N21-5 TaxID=2836867 RepID=UPI001C44A769|nr:SDR family oxidoreductase [Maritimibacter sp. DP1N21-5]MBV7408488.1 SDR family oxidoreductase [Maritimibacter sp. DP1N21-5]